MDWIGIMNVAAPVVLAGCAGGAVYAVFRLREARMRETIAAFRENQPRGTAESFEIQFNAARGDFLLEITNGGKGPGVFMTARDALNLSEWMRTHAERVVRGDC